MDLENAVSYVATLLALDSLQRLREADAGGYGRGETRMLSREDEQKLARMRADLNAQACDKLGIGNEYRETFAHLLKCNPVKSGYRLPQPA